MLYQLSGGRLFKKYSNNQCENSPGIAELQTWKVDWIDEQGNKGTYESGETDVQEAEWKFKYLYDDTRRIIKMYEGKPKH
ncbi:hypothetical protein [Catalinimonas alkaloidigena]|uniref:hypothetical protein n=1 Tax=Catalinimonas alkaloidigena TaxID=1075417 RepID=UPI00240627B3|nr:hypothetical protein [Catalinimonas alkaloidigena]